MGTRAKKAQNVPELLKAAGVGPSAQRVAVAQYVLFTEDHPSADQVWKVVRERFPMISRATVYNTLNLFVAKGLLRSFALKEGYAVFDPHLEPHHHVVDEQSGVIYDLPWEALQVSGIEKLKGFDIAQHQVVLRGRVREA